MNIDDILVWDIETLKEYSLFSFYNPKEEKWYEFSINKWENDLYSFVKFIEQNNRTYYFVGYNSMRFDAQVIEWVIRNYENWVDLSNLGITYLIWQKAQDIIDDMNYETFAEYHENQLSFKNIDIFRTAHYNNKNRLVSLKRLEFEMDFDNIEEMPIEHYRENLTKEEIQLIKEYCRNDIRATYAFWNILRGRTDHPLYKENDQLQFRKDIEEEFNIPSLSLSDGSIGNEIIKRYYLEETKIPIKELPKKGTFRKTIKLKDCIPSNISFKTKQLQNFLTRIKRITLSQNEDFLESIKFYDQTYTFAKGGIHNVIENKIYEADENTIIKDLDVGGYYPAIIINNSYYPKHLGKEFLTGYTRVYNKRIELKPLSKKDKRIKGIVGGLKFAGNVPYGLSLDMTSWLFDKQMGLSTCITGELSILMLIEKMELDGINCIMANTDGATFMFDKSKIPLYEKNKKEWVKEMFIKTKYELEEIDYKKLVFSTVNDYLGIKIDGEVKEKGDFAPDTLLEKNKGGRVIKLALKEYFTKGIPVDEYIYNYNNLFDFCYRAKSSKDFHYEGIKNGKINIYNKLIRYYVSTDGEKLFKIKNPECETRAAPKSEVNAGKWLGTVCNYIPDNSANNKNIDYSFYIEKAKEMIFKVENGRKPKKIKTNENQMSLF